MRFKNLVWLFVPVSCAAAVAWSNTESAGEGASAASNGESAKLAREVYAEKIEQIKNHEANDFEDLELWSRNLLGAELEAAAKPTERIAAHQGHVARTTELEKLAKALQRAGQGKHSDALAAEFYRLQAERALAEASRK